MNEVFLSCCVMHPEKANLSKWVASIPKWSQIVSCVVKQQDEFETQFEVIAETKNLVSLQYNFKSYDEDFDFAEIRNFMDTYAWGTWLLHIDSDESIATHHNELYDELQAMNETEAEAGWISIAGIMYDNAQSNQPRERYALHACRLLRKSSGIKWQGICHETPTLDEREVAMVDTNIMLLHDGYMIDEEGFQKKATRNGKLLIREYTRKPTFRCWNYLIKTFTNLKIKE